MRRTALEMFYSISYMLYGLMGFVTSLVTGVVVSLATGKDIHVNVT